MTRSLAPWFVALALVPACGDDGGGNTTTTTTTATGTSSDSSTTDDPTTGSTTDDPTTGVSTSSTSTTTDPGTGSETSGDATTGPINMCDPVVPGEWNSCVDGDGLVDNTLCNWTGSSGATGFIGCLNSSAMDGANVCMITGCEDDCDCFAPPTTGNAVVACAEVLEGGGMACVLTCDNGETCPDTMECLDGICFHPPAA